MKVLIADQDARLLTAITNTFGRHCDIVTVNCREACLAELGKHDFDVIVAGDRLVGYTGLELLSEVAAIAPATLRIFLARPARVQELAPRLEFFGLFGTLTYPLDPRKLLAELRRARESLKNSTASRKIRHVVLREEWDTGERPALVEKKGTIEISYALFDPPPAAAPSQSLSQLARVALKKRPLPDFRPQASSARRSKTLLLAGSGIAVAALATLLAVKATGSDAAAQAARPSAGVANTRLFSSGTTVVTNSAGIPTLSAPK